MNSHTRGEYLDEPKFWEISEAAESLGVPIYLHPNTPSPRMVGPFLDRGLDGAVFGFAVETSLHILRIVFSGVFDRFPKLRMVAGHLGEGLPYWFCLGSISLHATADFEQPLRKTSPKLQKGPASI